MDKKMDTLCGYVNHIVFLGSDGGFTVAKLKVPSVQEDITIVGLMPSLQPGETIQCKGTWKHHPQHGKQFEVASFDPKAPSDLIGIQKYLESGMIGRDRPGLCRADRQGVWDRDIRGHRHIP